MRTGRDGGGQAHRPGRAAARVVGGAIPWGGAVARPAYVPGQLWPGTLLGVLRDRLRADVAAEAVSGRLILWLPVLFGAGILLYFGAAQEPSHLAALGVTLALAGAVWMARAQPVTFGAFLAALALATGFTVACAQTSWRAHPVLLPPPGPVRLTGHIQQVERRATADRILLRVTSVEGRGLDHRPDLVRLSLGRGYAPATGSSVSILARLLPPMQPAMPGGHDFGRGLWFQDIDAVGFGLGRPKPAPVTTPPPLSVTIGTLIEQVRRGVGERIRQSLSGAQADIAVALVVGDRSAISPAIEESMRVSGLTHVLSISGLHMAMVAGTLFALVRGLLAMVPRLALGFPIKTTAAVAALLASAVYLVLSGNDWPAQRSFYMLAIVLVGVMVGRAALNLRTVAVAAMAVLALGPQAILEAGTQMSFAATLALVAVYQRFRGLHAWHPKVHAGWQMLAKAGVFLAALSLTSVVAGAATAPYAALHFQRVGAYGLLSNLAAMPAVEFLVMPFGLAGVLLLPFGWDFIAWPVMGWGIEVMLRVSDLVAALPGADTRTDLVTPAAAGAATLALLCLCLFGGVLRLTAVLPALAAVLLLGAPPHPDVLVAPNAQTVAVRAADGRLSVVGAKSSRLVVEQWLSREGDTRAAPTPDLAAAFRCDGQGCVAPLPGGGWLAVSHRLESLERDCLEATILVTPFPPPRRCEARVISSAELARTGTLALYRRSEAVSAGMLHGSPLSPARSDPSWQSALPDAEVSESGSDDLADGDEIAMPPRSAAPMTILPASAAPPAGGSPSPAHTFVGTGAVRTINPAGDTASPDPAAVPALRHRPRRMAADHRASLRRQARAGPPAATEPIEGAMAHPDQQGHERQQAQPDAAIQSSAQDPRVQPAVGPQPNRRTLIAARGPPQRDQFAARWRVEPTRPVGVQRPWMPVLPPLPAAEPSEDLATQRAADDAAGAP